MSKVRREPKPLPITQPISPGCPRSPTPPLSSLHRTEPLPRSLTLALPWKLKVRTYSPRLVSLCRTRKTPWESVPPARTSWAALSRESIPWNQGYPERGWSPSPPSDSPWNRNDPSGRREGGKPGCQVREACFIWEKKSFAFPSCVTSLPLGQTPRDPKTTGSRGWASEPGGRNTLTPLVPVAVSGVSRGG